MTTINNITLKPGITHSHTVTVADTSSRTYRGKVVDRFWSKLVDLTCTITDGTTVTVSLTATQTSDIEIPCNIPFQDRKGHLGWYDVEEVNGATITQIEAGRVDISRAATVGVDD